MKIQNTGSTKQKKTQNTEHNNRKYIILTLRITENCQYRNWNIVHTQYRKKYKTQNMQNRENSKKGVTKNTENTQYR